MKQLVIRWSLAAAGVVPLAAMMGGGASGLDPHEYTVVATDYAFQLPTPIAAGMATFAFENHGKVRHEFTITLVKRDVSADSIGWALTHRVPRRQLIDGQAALLIASPDEPPGPRILLQLERGRTYLVSCVLADGPDKPPHVMLGMFTTFVAQ